MNTTHRFWGSPVTKAFVALLDNYERETGKPEDYSTEERKEMTHFLQVYPHQKHPAVPSCAQQGRLGCMAWSRT